MKFAVAILILACLLGCGDSRGEAMHAFRGGDSRPSYRVGHRLPRAVPPEPKHVPDERRKQEFERYRVQIRDAVERMSGEPTRVVVFTGLVSMQNGNGLQVVISDELASLCVVDGVKCERNLSHSPGDDGSRYVFHLNERNSPDDMRAQSFLDIILFPKDAVSVDDVVAVLSDKGHVWVEPWSEEFPPLVAAKTRTARAIHDTAESQQRIEQRMDAIEEKLDRLINATEGD
jgi:hypothetical protein